MSPSVMRRFALVSALAVAACGGPPAAPPTAPRPAPPQDGSAAQVHLADLEQPPAPRLLDIEWSTVNLATPADALALWARIAPTGFDWEDKLGELPEAVQRPLALALLEGGNFTCMPPAPKQDCAPPVFDVKEPAHTAGFTDPCLRRLLALWAVDKIDDADLPRLAGVLRAIVAIPPPESELVTAVLLAIPEDDHARRLELLALAWRAGQHEVVAGAVGKLDEAHLIEAVTKHHIEPALEILSAEGHRATYLAAVTDDQLGDEARTRAIADLVATDDKLAPDVRAVLVKAAAAKDCTVAATAARLLDRFGDRRFVPAPPRSRTIAAMMRSLCVLASYEHQQGADEPSRLAGYVPKHGLERITILYDALGEVDSDGDGDPHTERSIDLIPRAELVVPEVEDLIRAMHACTGTTCKSNDHEFRFGFKTTGGVLVLARLEVVDRPPCPHSP